MRKLIYTLLLMLFWGQLLAQTPLPKDDPTYQQVNKVYHRLCRAVGDYRKALPELMVLDRVQRVASYRSWDNRLIIEKKAFEICKTLGQPQAEAALAFLIGHELTHFYQQHDWGASSGESGFGTQFLMDREVFSKQVHHEEEADIYGAFVAHLAGYEVLPIIPKVLDAIYKGYTLDANLQNYPPLKERKAVAQKVEAKVHELITIYDHANYFNALGWHVQALASYRYLLKFVKSKELYNNLGQTLLAMAILNQEKEDLGLLLPIQIELKHALRDFSFFEGRKVLLGKAAQSLRKALDFDPNYTRARLNLVCTYLLQGNTHRASLQLRQVKTEKASTKAQAQILAALIDAYEGQKRSAIANLETIKHPNWESLAKTNIALLKGEKISDKPDSYKGQHPKRELIGKVGLAVYQAIDLNHKVLLEQNDFWGLALDFGEADNCQLAKFELNNHLEGTQRLFLLQRSQKAALSQSSIGMGSTVEQLKKAYPWTTFRQVAHSNGYFLVSFDKRLIFSISDKQTVVEWAVFGQF